MESGRGLRLPPRSGKCLYCIPASCSDLSNADWLNCGYLLEPGILRISASNCISKECSIARKSAMGWVKWPMVYIVFKTGIEVQKTCRKNTHYIGQWLNNLAIKNAADAAAEPMSITRNAPPSGFWPVAFALKKPNTKRQMTVMMQEYLRPSKGEVVKK